MSETTPAGAANASADSFAPETAALTSAPMPEVSSATNTNSALQRCMDAYEKGWMEVLEKEEYRNNSNAEYHARKNANLAYEDAMPQLNGPASVQDFIACVAHAVLLKVMERQTAASLLYAAQIAFNCQRREPRAPGRPRLSDRPDPSTHPEAAEPAKAPQVAPSPADQPPC